jgi:predicted lipid carrier protein YhbT
MDAIEPEAMPTALRTAIQQMAAFVDAGMKQDAKAGQARAGALC